MSDYQVSTTDLKEEESILRRSIVHARDDYMYYVYADKLKDVIKVDPLRIVSDDPETSPSLAETITFAEDTCLAYKDDQVVVVLDEHPCSETGWNASGQGQGLDVEKCPGQFPLHCAWSTPPHPEAQARL